MNGATPIVEPGVSKGMPPNPLYDPYSKTVMWGANPNLVVLCGYCNISVGSVIRKELMKGHTVERCEKVREDRKKSLDETVKRNRKRRS